MDEWRPIQPESNIPSGSQTDAPANKIDVDYRVTRKNFAFASKRNLPFFFVSASDGTNVVQLFTEAIRLAVDCKQNPPAGDFVQDVLDLLGDK